MKTSISSEAPSQLGAEKIAFLPKPDRRTYGQTDISNYRVASLLKTKKLPLLCVAEQAMDPETKPNHQEIPPSPLSTPEKKNTIIKKLVGCLLVCYFQ